MISTNTFLCYMLVVVTQYRWLCTTVGRFKTTVRAMSTVARMGALNEQLRRSKRKKYQWLIIAALEEADGQQKGQV